MTGITHPFVSGVSEGADPTLVGPNEWNDPHAVDSVAPSGLTGSTAASRYVGATASGAPTTGAHLVGDWIVDQAGIRWTCIAAATPGTWVQEPGTGGGIIVKDEGGALATAADTLDFVGAGVVASGTGAVKTITISGAAVADIVDIPTAEDDDTLVLAPDGIGGVEFRPEAGGSIAVSDGGTPVSPVTSIVFTGAVVTDGGSGEADVSISVANTIIVKDEGSPLATAADTLDFVGAGVVASGTGAVKTITIAGGGGIADEGAFTYLDATGASAPGNPASGSARIYAKTDGRVYSRDNGGTEYGPFDAAGGGGVDLSAFRLAGVADDPGDIALGTYGDEFEYATPTALAAVWPGVHNSGVGAPIVLGAGSAIYLATPGGLGGIVRAATIPYSCEVAVLISGNFAANVMLGLGFVDDSGGGPVMIGYSGYSWLWECSGYSYTSHGNAGSLPSGWAGGTPFWFRIKKMGTSWTAAHSIDGVTWTAAIVNEAHGGTPTHFFVGLTTNNFLGGIMIHRVVYGTPDLYSTPSVIPVMTSATAPSGVASASEYYSGQEAWKAMCGGINAGWLTNGSALPQWIEYQFAAPTVISSYGFMPWWVDNYPVRTPTEWQFQGYNGATWDVLDSQTAWAPSYPCDYVHFTVASPASYTRYRMYITANGGNAYTGLGGLVMV